MRTSCAFSASHSCLVAALAGEAPDIVLLSCCCTRPWVGVTLVVFMRNAHLCVICASLTFLQAEVAEEAAACHLVLVWSCYCLSLFLNCNMPLPRVSCRYRGGQGGG
jgi:hypothetical protein